MEYFDQSPLSGIGNDKIHELVRNLVGLLREKTIDSIFKSRDYMRKWFEENVHLEGVNVDDAFYYGYFVGAACIHEFYRPKSADGQKPEAEEE